MLNLIAGLHPKLTNCRSFRFIYDICPFFQICVTDFDVLQARLADNFLGELGEKTYECKLFLQKLPFEFYKD